MADACCKTIAGGRVEIIQNGRIFAGVGDVVIRPTLFSRDANASSNGKMYGTVKAELAEADIVLANLCEQDPIELFDPNCDADYTFVERDRGFRHLYNASMTTGRPEINLSSGEVSGMTIKTDSYQRQG